MPGLIKVLDKRRFLLAAMAELVGSAHISFEGDLSKTKLLQMPDVSVKATTVLKRSTLWPVQDFAILPLEADRLGQIIAAIGGTIPRGIIHLQVEKCGELELGLYDNFDSQAMFMGPSLKPAFFAMLQNGQIIRPYERR